jgi:hypothetical protein
MGSWECYAGARHRSGCFSDAQRHINALVPRVNDSLQQQIPCKLKYFEEAEERLRSMYLEEAVQLYEMAEREGYDADACAGGRWICHMLLGKFERAWDESDVIARRGRPDPHRFWDGRPFHGRKVLIRCLHGLGDTLQFIRYAPLIRAHARAVTVEAQPALKTIIQKSGLADSVITWGEQEPSWDQQIEIVELPRIFRTTPETIPNSVPYLDMPSVPAVARYDGTRPLRVGVVWASSTYNPARSVPILQMARLFDVEHTLFFSLQAGEERAQIKPWLGRVTDLQTDAACVLTTAENLKRLDLVITVDTMMAHLAGAMARPVWTLLPFQCDWRWMTARNDSPWYPSMKLFRQTQPSDWQSVIDRVHRAMETVVARATLECLA